MSRLTDEVLSAYIDGELQPAEAARVALELTRDPEAFRRLNALRAGDAVIRDAFHWPMAGQSALAERFVAETERESAWRRPLSIAAFVATGVIFVSVAGFAAGQWTAPREVRIDPDRGALAAGGLAHALETQSSDASGPLRIALTFQARDGRYCRQFAFAGGLQGVACRYQRGWRLEALSTPDPAADGGAMARTVADIGVSQTIGLTQEQRLIGSGWRDEGAALALR